MIQLQAGLTDTAIFQPEVQHLASSVGNVGVDVVATTAIILFFETAANDLVSPWFEPGEVTVGTHVEVDHLAPAFAGQPLNITATLKKHRGSRLEFELVARQGEVVVMTGSHHRAVVARDKFDLTESDPNHQVAAARQQIDFWFDFHSPWCYFACHQIGNIARQFNAVLNWKPVHLANLNKAVDGRRPLEANPRFVAWYEQDQRDTAALLGLPFDPHEEYPKRPSRALRGAIHADEHGLAEPFVKALMRGYWSRQQDISELALVRATGESVGLDGDQLESSMSADEYRGKLEQNLQDAIAHNLFGLPAAVTDGKIFWGNDRLDLLRHYLRTSPPAES